MSAGAGTTLSIPSTERCPRRVGPDELAHRLDVVRRGDEFAAGRHVHAVEAREPDRRAAHAHVDLRGAGAADQPHQLPQRGAADDRVLDDDHPLALEDPGHRVELQVDLQVPLGLAGIDERAADVVAPDEADLEPDVRRLGVPQRRRVGRVGHADDDVGPGRMLLGQLAAERAADLVGHRAEDAAVRPRDVDVLEDAHRPVRRRGQAPARHALRVDDQHLARLDAPHVVGPHDVQRARLRRHHRGAPQAAETKRPETERVAHGDHLVPRQEQEAVRPGPATGPRRSCRAGGPPGHGQSGAARSRSRPWSGRSSPGPPSPAGVPPR